MRPQDADSARWRRGILSAHCGDGDKWKVLFEARSGERMADKMTTWKTTYISASVHQAGDNPIINDHSTTVTICDEAGGAFVSLTDCEGTTIKLDPDEFEIVANVARGMIENFEDKPRTPISVVNEAFNKAEAIFSSLKSEMLEANDDPNQPYVTEWFDGMRNSLVAVAEKNVEQAISRDDRSDKVIQNGSYHNDTKLVKSL